MKIQDIYNEEGLWERFKQGYFPSFKEILSSTDILELGDDQAYLDLKIWYRKLYHRFYQRERRLTKPKYLIFYTREEKEKLQKKVKQAGVSTVRYIKNAALQFGSQQPLPCCCKAVNQCKFTLLDHYDVVIKLSREGDTNTREGYGLMAEIIAELVKSCDKFIKSQTRNHNGGES